MTMGTAPRSQSQNQDLERLLDCCPLSACVVFTVLLLSYSVDDYSADNRVQQFDSRSGTWRSL